ncbi:hypothetical protein [Nocardioides sp.]|uniref:hypothetical protein n=1 Tax=Nocardioides sp. TaxID=35761 RepID=UPI00286A9F6E|nr:hypothetical protein [Nocardioides sp.]
MPLTLLARVAGVLGGLCLLVRAAAGVDALRWPGLVLLALALAALGAGLVSTSATWLRAIVAVALPVLVWSVVEVVGGEGDGRVVDAVAGVVVALVCVRALVRSRGERHPAGSHSA